MDNSGNKNWFDNLGSAFFGKPDSPPQPAPAGPKPDGSSNKTDGSGQNTADNDDDDNDDDLKSLLPILRLVRPIEPSLSSGLLADDMPRNTTSRLNRIVADNGFTPEQLAASYVPTEVPDEPDTRLADWALWDNIIRNFSEPESIPARTEYARRRGIPNPLRGLAWQELAGTRTREPLLYVYDETMKLVRALFSGQSPALPDQPLPPASGSDLNEPEREIVRLITDFNRSFLRNRKNIGALKERIEKASKEIRQDVRRTNNVKQSDTKQQRDIHNICLVYALLDEKTGYSQGLNHLLAPLLAHMPAEEVFSMFVQLMVRYGMREIFCSGPRELVGARRLAAVMYRYIPLVSPELAIYLYQNDIVITNTFHDWILTLFSNGNAPAEFISTVMDFIVFKGPLVTILTFGMAILHRKSVSDRLIKCTTQEAFQKVLEQYAFFHVEDKGLGRQPVVTSAHAEIARIAALILPGMLIPAYSVEWEQEQRRESATMDSLERRVSAKLAEQADRKLSLKLNELEAKLAREHELELTKVQKDATDALQEELDKNRALVAGLRVEIKRLDTERQRLNGVVAEHEKDKIRSDALQEEVDNNVVVIAGLKVEIKRLDAERQRLDGVVAELEKEKFSNDANDALKQKIDSNGAIITGLKAQIKWLENELEKKSSQAAAVNNLEKEMAVLKQKLEQAERERASAEAEANGAAAALRAENERLAKLAGAVDPDAVDRLAQEVTMLKTELEKTSAARAAGEAKAKEDAAAAAALREQDQASIDKLNGDLERASEEVSRHLGRLGRLQAQYGELAGRTDDLAALEQEKQQLGRALEEARLDRQRLEHALAAREQDKQRLEKSVAEARQELGQSERARQADVEVLAGTRDRLQQRLADETARADKAVAERDGCGSRNAELEELVKSLRAEIGRKESEHAAEKAALERSSDELRARVEGMERWASAGQNFFKKG